MKKFVKNIPDGFKDILFDECSTKVNIQHRLRKTYLSSGFKEIISPTVEFYDVFDDEDSYITQDKMYKLFDNKGRILVLRPDMTTVIGRIAATKLKYESYPLRLCYTTNIFRVNESFDGKHSETSQSGIEIIGSNKPFCDSDVIITAIDALSSINIKDFKIEIGHSQLVKALIEDMDINCEHKEYIKNLLSNKNYLKLKKFICDNKENIDKNTFEFMKLLPNLSGGIEVINKGRELIKNEKALKALDDIYEVYSIVKAVGLSDFLTIDLALINELDYYTGIVFKGYSSYIGQDILSGGRYDKLLSKFECSMPATGFAINVDSALKVIKKQNMIVKNLSDFIVYAEEGARALAYEIAWKVREKGYKAEMSLMDGVESTINYAKEKEIKKLLIINREGSADLANLNEDKLKFISLGSKDEIIEELLK